MIIFKLILVKKMKQFAKNQQIQEDEYSFPHHYVPQFEPYFQTSIYSGYGINYVSALELILDELDGVKFDSMADVGTGDGRLVKEFAVKFNDKEVCGIDYSERAINLARGLNPKLNFLNADIINDNVGKSFDALTLIEVFEHIPLDITSDFVKALSKLLNTNGVLLLTVPHSNVPVSPKHYQHFTGKSLKAHFTGMFDVEKEIYIQTNRSWRLWLIHRLLKNKLFLLNHKGLLNSLYRMYKKKCFNVPESDCSRIYLKLRKK